MTARRMGRAVNGSYVEFSSSTRRRPQMEPSWYWADGCRRCAGRATAHALPRARISPPRPRGAGGRGSSCAAPYVLRPIVHHGLGTIARQFCAVFAGQSREHPVTRPPDRGLQDQRTRRSAQEHRGGGASDATCQSMRRRDDGRREDRRTPVTRDRPRRTRGGHPRGATEVARRRHGPQWWR